MVLAREPSDVTAWAIIPARGGSKGIPRKNLAPIGGTPLLARAIRTCLSSASIARTVVSTEDPEIAALGEAEGATVVWRPNEFASDTASSESVVQHAIASLTQPGAPGPRFALLVQCTSPFITSEDVDNVVSLLRSGRVDSCFTAAPSHRFLWRRDRSGVVSAVNHDPGERLPRQSLDPEFVETGAIYGFVASSFLNFQKRFFGRIGIVEVDGTRAMEIDDPGDLQLAQALETLIGPDRSSTKASDLPDIVRAVIFDFDGVMTNDRVTIDETGIESVVASRGDGLGISLLRSRTSLRLLVISSETNGVVKKRCEKIGVECFSGVAEKDVALQLWLEKANIDPSECIYVGNDINDLPAMKVVAWSAVPSDAESSVKLQANLVLTKRGGEGAVRELANILLEHPGTIGRISS